MIKEKIEKLIGTKFQHTLKFGDINTTIFTIEEYQGNTVKLSWDSKSLYNGRKKTSYVEIMTYTLLKNIENGNYKLLPTDETNRIVWDESGKRAIYDFLRYYDGNHYIEPVSKYNTFELGVTDLEWLPEGALQVTLRRPGLLIGESGKNINAAEEFFGFKIKIVEKKF